MMSFWTTFGVQVLVRQLECWALAEWADHWGLLGAIGEGPIRPYCGAQALLGRLIGNIGCLDAWGLSDRLVNGG